MVYDENNLLPISALQHLLFCERQCALIHVERLWAENRFTAEGNRLHEKAHAGKPETRGGVRIIRGLPLHSFTLGLVGQADVVECEPPASQRLTARTLAEVLRNAGDDERKLWRVTPVEYKRGKPKQNDCDRVQLCAQAICLEEMLGITIAAGEVFYGEKRRRVSVEFNSDLRDKTAQAARRLHEIVDGRITPPAVREKKCETCSLFHLCLPEATSHKKSARKYLERMLQ